MTCSSQTRLMQKGPHTQGPPGTGKTRTIHALVEALATIFTAAEQAQSGGRSRQRTSTLLKNGKGRKQQQEAAERPRPGWVGLEDAPVPVPPGRMLGQILVCADTNAATDNIVEGLLAVGINVVRIGQPAKVSTRCSPSGMLQPCTGGLLDQAGTDSALLTRHVCLLSDARGPDETAQSALEAGVHQLL